MDLRGLCCPACVYKPRLYKKQSAERRFHVQVPPTRPIIDPIPKDLCRKPRPETPFGVQTRLVHSNIDSAGQIHLEETGIALIPVVDEYEIVK